MTRTATAMAALAIASTGSGLAPAQASFAARPAAATSQDWALGAVRDGYGTAALHDLQEHRDLTCSRRGAHAAHCDSEWKTGPCLASGAIELTRISARSARYTIQFGSSDGDPVCDAKVHRSGTVTAHELRRWSIA